MTSAISIDIRSGRRWGRRLGSILTACSVSAALTTAMLPAYADKAISPKGSSFTIHGAGYGHARGMSQYGAYGAAKRGLSWQQIVSFYYPGTRRVQQAEGTSIRVWITADTDNDLRVLPAPGLRLSDSSGTVHALPTGSTFKAWRVTRIGNGFALSYQRSSGSWARQVTPLKGSDTWWFSNTAKVVKVWVPGGARRELRGSVALVKRGTGGRTVNRLSMEAYLRGVVPAEMPTSWLQAAVRSQAVAARSYAARLKSAARAGTGYHVCDTTSCQVYRGYARTVSGRRTVFETKGGNAAVKATDRTVLMYGSSVALTEFASSNGGVSTKGHVPYLVAKLDPYDAVISTNTWKRTITTASLARVWPAAGSVKQLQVSKREGIGRYGGHVTSVKVVGSRSTVTVSGGTFASRFGFRSRLFTISAPGPLS